MIREATEAIMSVSGESLHELLESPDRRCLGCLEDPKTLEIQNLWTTCV